MKNLSDYVYISQMDSDITDLTDKIFEENIEWQKHKWADTQGEVVNSDDIDVVYHDGKDEKDEKLYQEYSNI